MSGTFKLLGLQICIGLPEGINKEKFRKNSPKF
jgi:hypothetical protein